MNMIPTSLYPLLALDPSSTNIGWALVNAGPRYLESGTFILPSAPPDQRVELVGPYVTQLLNSLSLRPAQVLIEIPDYIDKERVNATKIIPFFRAVGAVEATVSAFKLPIVRVHASRMKQQNRKERYKDFFYLVAQRYPVTDDESDALAMAWEYVSSAASAVGSTLPLPPL